MIIGHDYIGDISPVFGGAMKDGNAGALLQERIAELMRDGSEWTIMQLMRALGASLGGVTGAMRKMQAREEVSVVGDVVEGARGPRSRVFRGTVRLPDPDRSVKAGRSKSVGRRWPSADPELNAAILAMARHDQD